MLRLSHSLQKGWPSSHLRCLIRQVQHPLLDLLLTGTLAGNIVRGVGVTGGGLNLETRVWEVRELHVGKVGENVSAHDPHGEDGCYGR